jgi:hypothetical protein
MLKSSTKSHSNEKQQKQRDSRSPHSNHSSNSIRDSRSHSKSKHDEIINDSNEYDQSSNFKNQSSPHSKRSSVQANEPVEQIEQTRKNSNLYF